jgi:hypothetical protein
LHTEIKVYLVVSATRYGGEKSAAKIKELGHWANRFGALEIGGWDLKICEFEVWTFNFS